MKPTLGFGVADAPQKPNLARAALKNLYAINEIYWRLFIPILKLMQMRSSSLRFVSTP
jgi:hypothetical protein